MTVSRPGHHGTGPTRSAGPLTRHQLLLVDLCLLLAVAAIWNRPYFPLWARPETWGLTRGISDDQAWILEEARRLGSLARLEGRPTLVVGDSLIMGHPWEADTLCMPGNTVRMIADKLATSLEERHYARIVLWAGSSDHEAFADEGAQYVHDMLDLIATAEDHADEVMVIGPMPYMAREWTEATKRGARGTPLPPPVVSAAVAALKPHVPDMHVVDVVPFRTRAIQDGTFGEYWRDGLHLQYSGFAKLTEYLDAADCDLVLLPPPFSDGPPRTTEGNTAPTQHS